MHHHWTHAPDDLPPPALSTDEEIAARALAARQIVDAIETLLRDDSSRALSTDALTALVRRRSDLIQLVDWAERMISYSAGPDLGDYPGPCDLGVWASLEERAAECRDVAAYYDRLAEVLS